MNLRLLVALFLFTVIGIQAQDYSDSWTGYFSYNSITAVAQSESRIYAAAQNSIFSYAITSNEIETISTIQGLTGEAISSIYYEDNT